MTDRKQSMPNAGALLFFIMLVIGAASASPARAADARKSDEAPYPTKPIRIVSPLSPGGSGDAVARMVGEMLTDTLGQAVVIDNRPGANGIIGVDLVAKAAPDGYTLLVATGGNITINPALYGAKLPFNVERDLVPLTQIATQSFVANVSPSFPVKSISDLISLARARPGSINYASAGAGSTTHMMTVLFESLTGVRMTHVPFKGSSQARISVMSRESDLMIDGLVSTLPLIKAGKLRGLAVTGAKRSVVAPDIPTISEAGVPGYSADAWYGLFAPRGTSRLVVEKLSVSIIQSLRSPEKREKLVAQGAEPVGSTQAEFLPFLKAETAKWAKVVKAASMKPE